MKKIFVDGSCIGNPGQSECRGVMDGVQIFRYSLGYGTNNIAEFIAIVCGIQYAKSNLENEQVEIYSDSRTAISWVRDRCANSSMESHSLTRAEDYLRHVDMKNVRVLKWDTQLQGEIPADFGRK